MADTGTGTDPDTGRCESCGHLDGTDCGCSCCGMWPGVELECGHVAGTDGILEVCAVGHPDGVQCIRCHICHDWKRRAVRDD